MARRLKRVSGDLLSGKRITFAPSDQVESFGVLVNDFMSSIFELEPGEHMITDESDLLDFTPLDSSDTSEIWVRISERYGIARSDVTSERLVAVLAAIQQKRHLQ
jgi:acyl carrier protein